MAAQPPNRCRAGHLFVADGIDHLLEVVGGFLADCDDDAPAPLTDARSVSG
jgi:hypothetical protein